MDERGDRTPLFGDTNQTRPKSADSSPLYHDQSQSPTNVSTRDIQLYVNVTTRKQSLRRLCFYSCLSVHRGGVCPIACWDTPTQDQRQTPPWADTPPGPEADPLGQTPPSQADAPGQTPPWVHTPPGRHPWADTPPGRHPPCADTPPAQCMLGYDQQAGGTHPTGMHSCFPIGIQVGRV